MSSNKSIDELIKSAMENGEFDNLPGSGKPLDLGDYFQTPEELRITYSLLKNAGFLPDEIEKFKEIETLKSEMKTCETDQRKKEIIKQINKLTLIINIKMENFRNKSSWLNFNLL
jgi:hypothetical protein